MSASSLYLCVDCGGTKTSAVICDNRGEIVGRALGGPSNFSYLGLQPFVNVLQSTVEKALSAAISSSNPIDTSTPDRFASVWIGVSGVDSPNDIRTLTSAVSQAFSIPPGNRLQITNDAHLLASPLRSHKELKGAVAVIAGTGSVVISFARDDEAGHEGQGSAPLKEMARAGGWGWILGDVGSGFEVGREAVREILARADLASVDGPTQVEPALATNAEPPSLRSRIFSHFGINSAPDIFSVIYAPDPLGPAAAGTIPSTTPASTTISNDGATKPTENAISAPGPHPTSLLLREQRLSRLTPLVFQSAFEDGDELALTVLRTCAGNLARVIATLLAPPSDPSRAKANTVEASSSVLCLGGSLVGIANYRNLVLEDLKAQGHVFAAVEFVGDGDVAAAGAKGLALAAQT